MGGWALEAGCAYGQAGGRASRLYRVDLHFLAGVLLLLFLLVLGQQEVQEEGHDEADRVRRFEEDALGPVCPVPVTVRSILVTIPTDRKRLLI